MARRVGPIRPISTSARVVDRSVSRRIVIAVAVALSLAGCGAATIPTPSDGGPVGRLADGTPVRIEIVGDKIKRVTAGNAGDPKAASTAWLWLPITDSHVHLVYWPVADRLASSGVAAAVDLAAPESTLGTASPIAVLSAGPMLTHDHGYPLDSWGSAGYGIGCADAACVTQTIDRLAEKGVRVIKLALDDDGLDPALAPVAVTAAHAKGLKVAVHALSDAGAALGARAGADLLAHTPVEALHDDTIRAWRGRAVISTLAAFGGGAAAIENLRKLRAAGATVLYGTDLGNLRDAGPSAAEIRLLARAGLDDAAITAAMTTTPATYWGLPFALTTGSEASFLVLDRDPRTEVTTLLAPHEVWLRGRRR